MRSQVIGCLNLSTVSLQACKVINYLVEKIKMTIYNEEMRKVVTTHRHNNYMK